MQIDVKVSAMERETIQVRIGYDLAFGSCRFRKHRTASTKLMTSLGNFLLFHCDTVSCEKLKGLSSDEVATALKLQACRKTQRLD